MPVNVHKEQIDGTGYEISLDGSRLVLARKVSNLTSYTGHDRHLKVFFDQPTGFMWFGQQFPYPLPPEFSAMFLRTVQIEPLNADCANYIYTFTTPDDPAIDLEPSDGVPPTTYELDYTVESVETEFDVLGNVITGTYAPTQGQPGVVWYAKIATDESLQIFRYRRREVNPAGGTPAVYHNKVNSNQFTFAGETHAPRTWLCRSIRISSVYGVFGQAYDVDYEFVRRNKLVKFGGIDADIGWDATAAYEDPVTGQRPAGLTVANGGIKLVTMKASVDFSNLNLWV